MVALGKLSKVDIRDIWKHEAHDFTQWLAMESNLTLLGDELGLDLELEGTEVDVGGFKVDLLATDSTTGGRVIIENQLEATDHDHLGKLITYAAGHDATYLIWIAKDARQEHQSAIEWLNNHLDDKASCFLVRIEAWAVDGSPPAPRFEVVQQKNDWNQIVKGSLAGKTRSDLQNNQMQFWTQILRLMKEMQPSLPLRSARPQMWTDLKLGGLLCHRSLTVNKTRSEIYASLYIRNNFDFLEYLQDHENEITQCLQKEITWFRAAKASGFTFRQSVANVFDEQSYTEYAKWFCEAANKMEECILPYISDFKSQQESIRVNEAP